MNQANTLGLKPIRPAAHRHLTGTLRFATGPCALGQVLVARSVAGLCAILLDDDAAALRAQLQQAFPGHSLVRADAGLQQDLQRVRALVDARPGQVLTNLDLDTGGTPFQQRVWAALREIPLGQTLSYTQLALRIRAPRAVRAVAGACAANTLAVAIPCHRVLRRDGSMSGYRWGVQRKRALLAQECA